MSDWVPPFVGLGGACLVAGANFFVQRWRYRIDRLSLAVDHLCSEVNSAADLATNYWLLDTSQNDDAKKAREFEARLIGIQQRLQALLLAIKAMDNSLRLEDAELQFLNLFEQLTGGPFGTKSAR